MVPVRFLYQAGIHGPKPFGSGPDQDQKIVENLKPIRTDSGGAWIPDTRSRFLCPCPSLLYHVIWVSLGYFRDLDGPRTTCGRP